jgi:hypothetical protein
MRGATPGRHVAFAAGSGRCDYELPRPKRTAWPDIYRQRAMRLIRQSQYVTQCARRTALILTQEGGVPTFRLSIGRKKARVETILWSVQALLSAGLVAHWGIEIMSGVPDAYRGQHRGGLMLSAALLSGAVSNFTVSPRLRLALNVASAVLLAFAYFFGFVAR